MFQPPVGSAVLLTAMSRWFTVVKAPYAGFDFAFLALFAEAPLPMPPVERLRLTIEPGYAFGASAPSASPTNSTSVTSPKPDGVKAPVWGLPLPASGTCVVAAAPADTPTAAHAPTVASSASASRSRLNVPMSPLPSVLPARAVEQVQKGFIAWSYVKINISVRICRRLA